MSKCLSKKVWVVLRLIWFGYLHFEHSCILYIKGTSIKFPFFRNNHNNHIFTWWMDLVHTRSCTKVFIVKEKDLVLNVYFSRSQNIMYHNFLYLQMNIWMKLATSVHERWSHIVTCFAGKHNHINALFYSTHVRPKS